MNFGQAIEALEQGKKVQRTGWNGKNMFIFILPAMNVSVDVIKDPQLLKLAEDNGGNIECLPTIRMKTADNKVLTGWLASQTDIFAKDWQIVE